MKSNITGLILAGGSARRMGYIDKGLVKVKGKYLICHILEKLKPQVETVIINANRNIDIYKSINSKVVEDLTSQRLGPLAGIQSGLMHCKTELILVLPCDVPNIPSNICLKLYEKLVKEKAECAMPVTIDKNNKNRTHPAILLLKVNLLESLNLFINSGGRKIDMWTDKHKTTNVFFKDEYNFLNINRLEDIDRI